MIRDMRRLHPRGAAGRGICVDAEGATIGPDCSLVRRTSRGYHAINREDASALQKCLVDAAPDQVWLFRQCQRIADALNKGEIALAQIYGLRIRIEELDLRRLVQVALAKAGFNPDEPRIPRGDPHGGEWTTDGGPTDVPASANLLADRVDNEDSGSGIKWEMKPIPPVPPSNSSTLDSPNHAIATGGSTQSGPSSLFVPVSDFSGGFHDVVVDTWVDYFQKNGIPVVKAPAVRLIGSDGSVIGYPDIIVDVPSQGLTVVEVKTGEDPPLTLNQSAYLPLIQLGGHIYSTDPRVAQAGLVPGMPFPPMPVIILFAPGPNQPYESLRLPEPTFEP